MIVTANLPSRDFERTEQFYARLGFRRTWRNDDWMILRRGDAVIEFFPHPDLDPAASWFSACIRTETLDALLAEFAALDIPSRGFPCLHPQMRRITVDLRMFTLIDPDGSLIRCLGP